MRVRLHEPGQRWTEQIPSRVLRSLIVVNQEKARVLRVNHESDLFSQLCMSFCLSAAVLHLEYGWTMAFYRRDNALLPSPMFIEQLEESIQRHALLGETVENHPTVPGCGFLKVKSVCDPLVEIRRKIELKGLTGTLSKPVPTEEVGHSRETAFTGVHCGSFPDHTEEAAPAGFSHLTRVIFRRHTKSAQTAPVSNVYLLVTASTRPCGPFGVSVPPHHMRFTGSTSMTRCARGICASSAWASRARRAFWSAARVSPFITRWKR